MTNWAGCPPCYRPHSPRVRALPLFCQVASPLCGGGRTRWASRRSTTPSSSSSTDSARAALRARAGHARTLAPLLGKTTTIDAGFPTTTAAALATLATGTLPGRARAGRLRVLDAANDSVVNQLTGWDDRLDPAHLAALADGVRAGGRDGRAQPAAIGLPKHSESGFTARHPARRRVRRRPQSMARPLRRGGRASWPDAGPGLTYLYVAELDQLAHAHGWESPEWTGALETLDAAGRLVRAPARPAAGRAPHRRPRRGRRAAERARAVRHGARAGRGGAAHRGGAALPAPATSSAGRRTADAPLAGALARRRGRPRLGRDARRGGGSGLVRPGRASGGRCRASATCSWPRASGSRTTTPAIRRGTGRNMIGQHGSLTADETRVPLLRFGAFAYRRAARVGTAGVRPGRRRVRAPKTISSQLGIDARPFSGARLRAGVPADDRGRSSGDSAEAERITATERTRRRRGDSSGQ